MMIDIYHGEKIPRNIKDTFNKLLTLLSIDLRDEPKQLLWNFLNQKPIIDWDLGRLIRRFLNRITTENLIFIDKLIDIYYEERNRIDQIFFFFKINLLIRIEGDDRAFNEARELADNAIIRFPEDEIRFIWEKSYVEIQRENFHEALEIISKALRKNPKHRELLLGEVFILVNNDLKDDSRKALELVDEVLKKNNKDPEFLDWRAIILLENGFPEEALEDVNTSLRLLPEHIGLYNTKIFILQRQHNFEDALVIAEEAQTLFVDNTIFLNWKAVLLNELLMSREALNTINNALRIDPNNRELLKTKIKILCDDGGFDSALEYSENCISKFRNDESFYGLKGDILIKKQEYDKALEAIEKGINIKRHSKWLYEKKIEILRLKGDYDLAQQEIETYKNTFGIDFRILFLTAKLQIRTMNYNESMNNLRKALQYSSDEVEKAVVYDTLSLNHIYLGQFGRAQKTLATAQQTYVTASYSRFHVAAEVFVSLERDYMNEAYEYSWEYYRRTKNNDRHLHLMVMTLMEIANNIFMFDRARAEQMYRKIEQLISKLDPLTGQENIFLELTNIIENNIIACDDEIDGEIITTLTSQNNRTVQFFPKLLKKL